MCHDSFTTWHAPKHLSIFSDLTHATEKRKAHLHCTLASHPTCSLPYLLMHCSEGADGVKVSLSSTRQAWEAGQEEKFSTPTSKTGGGGGTGTGHVLCCSMLQHACMETGQVLCPVTFPAPAPGLVASIQLFASCWACSSLPAHAWAGWAGAESKHNLYLLRLQLPPLLLQNSLIRQLCLGRQTAWRRVFLRGDGGTLSFFFLPSLPTTLLEDFLHASQNLYMFFLFYSF